jgi:CheY-like chemotaxis protein
MFRPETIAALSASLPAQANVLLWGIDDEALSRVEIQSPERRFFVAASDTTIEMLASMCWPRLSEDETTPATAPRPARRILLVDDDHTFARSLSRLLKTAGYEMTVAHGGHEALDLCRDGRFGAILTDLQMPGMNGLSFAAMVRLAMGKSAPKIVMITASASTVESDDLLDGLMQKPVATSTLLSLLKKLVPEEEEEESLE